MLTDVCHTISQLRFCIQDALHEVARVLRHELWDLKVATKDLFVQVTCVLVLERQVAAD